MSIPKIIHYCWFGKNPLPDDAKKCIESWKKYCTDYEIRLWDESNFDVSQNVYMKEAYEAKKWAFVTDVARLIIVYQYGGIYMDTDVELIKPLDSLLNYSAYMGYEGKNIATGLGIGAEKGNQFIKKLLDDYDGVHFVMNDGSLDMTACTSRNTALLKKLGLRADGTEQVIDNAIFLPEEYLCPMDYKTHEMTNLTKNTLSIHRYSASWKKWYEREKYLNKAALTGADRYIYYAAKTVKFLKRNWEEKNRIPERIAKRARMNRLKMRYGKSVSLSMDAKEWEKNIRVEIEPTGYVKIGKRACLRQNVEMWCEKNASIEIGSNVFIDSGVIMSARKKIVIGDDTMFGPHVMIYDHNHTHHFSDKKFEESEIVIGRNVLVGANVCILKGVTIGDNCIIGAGTVLTKDVPSGTIAYGKQNLTFKQIVRRD